MNSLRYRLVVWLVVGMVICTVISGLATYSRVRRAAGEFFDYQLAAVAANLPAEIVSQPQPPDDGDPNNDILIEIRDRSGKLVYPTQPAVRLPAGSRAGFSTVQLGSGGWRIYTVQQGERTIEVAQPLAAREHLATNLLVRAILPSAILVPALALFIWITVGRLLAPLRRVASAVSDRSPDALTPLPAAGSPAEIQPLLVALNGLLTQLDQAMSGQRAFVADAAHELRSPLTALKLQLQLAERAKTEAQRIQAFHKLHERLDRSARLVEQLLTLAREAPDGEPRVFADVELNGLVRELAADFAPHANHRRIELSAVVGPARVRATGRRESLRMMLSNVLDNALRYTPPGGRVQILLTQVGRRPTIRIEDSGPGIPHRDRGRVFDRFYRRSGSEPSGSGLGLAIVKTIADHHQCAIQLDDAPGGSGLVVTIVFPEQKRSVRADRGTVVESQ